VSKPNASKRARRSRKEARFAALEPNIGHPSHESGRRWKRSRKGKR